MTRGEREITTTKPWQTKAWKEMREKKIGDKCEQCGSEKEPFVLQHLWHPPKKFDLVDMVEHAFLDSSYIRFLEGLPPHVLHVLSL